MWRVLALLVLAACRHVDANDCICTVQVGDAAASSLVCGEEKCIGHTYYGCSEDEVEVFDRCGDDLAMLALTDAGAGSCIAAGTSCAGSAATCCTITSDAGVFATTCDPVTQACCIPVGSPCSTSNDCCKGHSCVILNGSAVCGS